MPALLTAMCRPPSSCTVRCTAASTAFSSVTSSAMPIALTPLPRSTSAVFCTASSFRSHTATAAPDAASSSAAARPMPDTPPVTIATLPVS